MVRTLWMMVLVLGIAQPIAAGEPKAALIADGLDNPSLVAVGPDGRTYVAGNGGVYVIRNGKAEPFYADIKIPCGMVAFQKWLFVMEAYGPIWRIDSKGKAEVHARPNVLGSLTVDPESGILYAFECGPPGTKGGPVYRIDPKGKISIVTDAQRLLAKGSLSGLAMDGASHLLLIDTAGMLYRVKIADGAYEELAEGLGNAAGITWDMHGRLFISDNRGGKVSVIPRPGNKPIPLKEAFKAPGGPAGICLDAARKSILVADSKAGTITALPAQVPGQPVDDSPLPLETALAFPDLKWTGWSGETDAGKVNPLRPIVLTHAGDGSNRVFVATQHGVIHVFPNDQKAKQTKVFLDIEKKVRYLDKENEEGFLGLCFHPDYKKTGEFFVFYTPRNEKLVNIVARYRVSKDDPDRADPTSEEIIYSVKRPFWNHDGGTICFGPDGMLYIALGDGGAANDPFDNAQNLKTPLGDILRIDINKKDSGKAYAVPPDNPFVNKADALPEIWAYGLRNVWRMAFDKKTGKLWAGDVGQNLYEEINIIEKGGNYGWRRREGLHPFGADGKGHGPDFIDPIWEYHHDIGKSITGGHVYRGKLLPELEGHYLYADYVSAKIWALRYDEQEKRVVANRTIKDKGQPVLSFGEDEQGEVYLMTYSAAGRGIYRFVRTDAKK